MKGVPAAVITLWMPVLISAGLFIFLKGLEPQYWLIWIAILPLLVFLNTLAEVQRQDKQIHIRRWWGSMFIDETEVIDISRSALRGVGRLRLRRFMPPWGVVYFVADWSKVEMQQRSVTPRQVPPLFHLRSRVANLFSAVLFAASGFALGRMLITDFHKFLFARPLASIPALTMSALLIMLFVFLQKRNGTLANVLLFIAMLIAALVRI